LLVIEVKQRLLDPKTRSRTNINASGALDGSTLLPNLVDQTNLTIVGDQTADTTQGCDAVGQRAGVQVDLCSSGVVPFVSSQHIFRSTDSAGRVVPNIAGILE
jgi:hypothetical protein